MTRALCVCGHPYEDHDGDGEECGTCEVNLLHDGVECIYPSDGSRVCRAYRTADRELAAAQRRAEIRREAGLSPRQEEP